MDNLTTASVESLSALAALKADLVIFEQDKLIDNREKFNRKKDRLLAYAEQYGFEAFQALRDGYQFLANLSSGQLCQLQGHGETSLTTQTTVEEALIDVETGIDRGAWLAAAEVLTSSTYNGGKQHAIALDIKTFDDLVQQLRSNPEHSPLEFNVEMISFTSREYREHVNKALKQIRNDDPAFYQRLQASLMPEMTGREIELADKYNQSYIAMLGVWADHGIDVGVDDLALNDVGEIADPRLGGQNFDAGRTGFKRVASRCIRRVKLDTNRSPLSDGGFDKPLKAGIAEQAIKSVVARTEAIGIQVSIAIEAVSNKDKFIQVLELMDKFFGLEISAQGFALSEQKPELTARRNPMLRPAVFSDRRSVAPLPQSTKAGKGLRVGRKVLVMLGGLVAVAGLMTGSDNRNSPLAGYAEDDPTEDERAPLPEQASSGDAENPSPTGITFADIDQRDQLGNNNFNDGRFTSGVAEVRTHDANGAAAGGIEIISIEGGTTADAAAAHAYVAGLNAASQAGAPNMAAAHGRVMASDAEAIRQALARGEPIVLSAGPRTPAP